ncbi:hypothetical protein LTS03_010230 [Exophiala xenobiotica]|nr:hypothetical protein LTS06_004103 [Exophiala xenobiotica]KAK5327726.1 hypothetical protein LTR93_003112 [Exophiala xenobiotica]KAK5348112.1 hypothetical protein LTR61_008364 [Exophiala xenobiotica]KAK5361607.1 hypothetical protein LTS03_010230 [Exophiala xenobiotica]KAK5378580.1 hypothetical protein LTR11_004275 [Exophiala xenobiotica]
MVADSTETQPPRVSGRLGSKKTKTGCFTCRQVKSSNSEAGVAHDCAENIGCTRLNLHCAGYQDVFRASGLSRERAAIPAHKPSQSAANLERQLSLFHGSDDERRLFEYFRKRVVFQLGGFLDEDFWITTLLQASHSESLIRYSVIAIAAYIGESNRHFRASMPIPQQSYNAALKYYQNALFRANRRTESADPELVAILSCPLFLCMEFLQGKKLQAMSLFLHGHFLMQSTSQHSATSGWATVNQSLRPMYNRLMMMAKLFGHNLTLPSSSNPTLSTFNSLKEARDILFQHLVVMHEFLKGLNSTTCPPEHYLQRQKELLIQLDTWNCNFREMCGSLDGPDHAVIATLITWHAAAVIWLRNPREGFEMSFDESLDYFQVIVEKANEALASKQHILDDFTFEMGVLPPLYFTALKCRHFSLRKEALRLLAKGPRREGLWDREELLTVASRAFALETAAQSDITSLPPEPERLRKVKIFQQDGGHELKAAFIYRDRKIEQVWNQIAR